MLINKAEETRLLYSLNTRRPSGAYALMNAHANQMGQPSHGHPTQSLCIATQWGQVRSKTGKDVLKQEIIGKKVVLARPVSRPVPDFDIIIVIVPSCVPSWILTGCHGPSCPVARF